MPAVWNHVWFGLRVLRRTSWFTAVGLYSVMSYAVSQRTQEMGIRMALGSQPGDVLGLVPKEGLRLIVPGLLAGSVMALAAARIVSGMLVNVSASDPLTFAFAAAFLG